MNHPCASSFSVQAVYDTPEREGEETFETGLPHSFIEHLFLVFAKSALLMCLYCLFGENVFQKSGKIK